MEANEIFAKNLKFYVIRSGSTQSKVASDLGVSKGTFSDWCSGRSHPRMNKVQQLADYFEINKSDLLEDGKEDTDAAKFIRLLNQRPVMRKMIFAAVKVDDDDLEHIVEIMERMGRKK